MGIHDFVCFVQRNGQYLNSFPPYEYEAQAMIVKIPTSTPTSITTKYDILSWDLEKFKEFSAVKVNYSIESYEFEGLSGYPEILSCTMNWWDQTIWQSPDADGFWLVNFSLDAYKIFVAQDANEFEKVYGLVNLDHIVDSDTEEDDTLHDFLLELFDNRAQIFPGSFKKAWKKIKYAGKDNLLEYRPDILINDELQANELQANEPQANIPLPVYNENRMTLEPDPLTRRIPSPQ
jgi:hypothetical protein